MAVDATLGGGAKHGLAKLTDAEREAASKALAKLKSPGGSLGSHLGSLTQHATVYGGSSAKIGGSASPMLIRGQGSDTFMGGVRGTPSHGPVDLGKDTVVSGSAPALGGHASHPDALGGHGHQTFSLSAETINVAGTTAETVKSEHARDAATSGHTITLADKTTVTISGLSQHDIAKLKH